MEIQTRAEQAADFLSALASRPRLLILCRLIEGEMSVNALSEALGLRQPAVSQQLALLKKDGLVRARRDGRTIYYAISDPKAERIIETLYDLFCRPSAEAPA